MDEVDSTFYPDALDLVKHWSDEPTPGMLLRAYFQVEKRKRPPDAIERRALTSALVNGGEARKVSGAPSHIRAAIEEMRKK